MDFKRKREKSMDVTEKVKKLISEGNYIQAEKSINKALKNEPKNPKFRSLLVTIYSRQGEFKKALRLVNHYIKDNPCDGVFISQKVDILIAKGNREEAKELLQWLVRNDLGDKKIFEKLKRIAEEEKNEEIIREMENRIKAEDRNVSEKRKESFAKGNTEATARRNIRKKDLRQRIYQKDKEVEEKLENIPLQALLGTEKREKIGNDIEAIQDYLFGIVQYGITNRHVTVEDINVLIQTSKRIGDKKKATEITKKLEETKDRFQGSEETIKQIKKGNRKLDFDDYVHEVHQKMNQDAIKPNQLAAILAKITKLQKNPLEGRVLAIELLDFFGYDTMKKEALERVYKKAKTDEEKLFLEKTIGKQEEKVGIQTTEIKKTTLGEQSIEGEEK